MKHLISTVYLAVFFSCFFGKAQISRNFNAVPSNANPQTQPANISQFEVSGRLITQNAFVGTTAIPAAQQTGSFGTTARWNSMGSLTTPGATGQTLNGFRSQTNGRGLTMGFSVANTGGTLSNPFIEIIGGNTAAPSVTTTVDDLQNLGSSSGNLDFRYAESPTGANSARRTAFTIQPVVNLPNGPQFDAFSYARANCLIGQLQSGK